MHSFSIRTRLFFGPDALDRLKALPYKRALLVLDPFVAKGPVCGELTSRLEAGGTAYRVFDGVVPDPPVAAVAEGVRAFLDFRPDAIVAVGGGSAIDSAKLVREFARKIDPAAADAAKLVAIPTTSGTGSELTSFAILTDEQQKKKISLAGDDILPDEAVLSVPLVSSVPPPLVADTGMDVMTHAIEAIVSDKANDFSDALAEKALALLGAHLLRSYSDPKDEEAKAKMHSASALAGAAFNASGLGLNHGMAHALGGRFHLPHGRTCSLLLPHVIAYNAGMESLGGRVAPAEPAVKGYRKIARILGLGTADATSAVRGLIAFIRFLQSEMKLPTRVSQTGKTTEGEYMAAIDAMTEAAIADFCTQGTPRPPMREAVAKIYRELW
jgi:alcohol dehydrogenase class IV